MRGPGGNAGAFFCVLCGPLERWANEPLVRTPSSINVLESLYREFEMKTFFAALAVLATVGSVNAATFTETTDFTNQAGGGFLTPSATPILLSDLGVNTISGSLNASCAPFGSCDSGDWSDSFSFSLAANRAIKSISVSVNNFAASLGGNSLDLTGNEIQLTEGQTSFFSLFSFTNSLTVNTISQIVNTPPDGIYSVNFQALKPQSIADLITADWSYAVELEEIVTSPVPLPGSFWLMLAGLGGVVALRRR